MLTSSPAHRFEPTIFFDQRVNMTKKKTDAGRTFVEPLVKGTTMVTEEEQKILAEIPVRPICQANNARAGRR
jgi:hypothetical protein